MIVHAIAEHVEDAGTHSGDATLVLPTVNLPHHIRDQVQDWYSKLSGVTAC